MTRELASVSDELQLVAGLKGKGHETEAPCP